VPNKSIKRNAQGQTVVGVVINQKTEERPVKLGLTDGNQTEVISGLQPGDIIAKSIPDNSAKSN
jgi:multidrug efflux pump subunit AcrA (membrane-fusion protein)